MKRAELKDKNVVVEIMTRSLQNDPHFGYLLEKSKNKNKFRIIMEYIFEESFNKGEIYLSDDNTATALWNIKKKETLTWKYISRNISFLFRIGFRSTYRILRMDKLVNQYHPRIEKFAHLYLIGVLPESRGKGYARELITYMVEKSKNNNTALYLETANTTNISIYNKIGFHVFQAINMNGHTLFCMNRH